MSCRTQYRTPPGPPAPSIAHVANADRQQQAACQSGTILARFPAWTGSNMANPSQIQANTVPHRTKHCFGRQPEIPSPHKLGFIWGMSNKAVAQAVEPEPGSDGIGDAVTEPVGVLHMARGAGPGWKDPAVLRFRRDIAISSALVKDSGQLPGNRKLQRLRGLGLPHPQDVPFLPLPAQTYYLAPPHAGEKADQKIVGDRGREPLRLLVSAEFSVISHVKDCCSALTLAHHWKLGSQT